MANQSYRVEMGGRYFILSISESQNVNTNQTTISCVLNMYNSYNYYTYNYGNRLVLKIGGVTIRDTPNVCAIQLPEGTTGPITLVNQGDLVYNHNPDGTLQLSVYMWFSQKQNTANTCEINVTHTCTTIPRTTIPSLSASTCYLENSVTISLPRNSDSFTHNIRYSIGSLSNQTSGLSSSDNVGTSCVFTPPESLSSQIASKNPVTCTLRVNTYNGSTLIGYKDVKLGLMVPNTEKYRPKITGITISEGASLPISDVGGFVRGKSRLSCGIGVQHTSLTAPISSYKTNINGIYYNGSSFTTDTIDYVGNLPISVEVEDVRGLKVTATASALFYDYYSPHVTAFDTFRCDESGNAAIDGNRVSVSISYDASSINNKNVVSYEILYSERSTTPTWIQLVTGNLYNLNTIFITDSIFDISKIYDLCVVVRDSFETQGVRKGDYIKSAEVIAHFRGDGTGVSFGGYSQGPGFEVYYDIVNFAQNIFLEKMYPVGSIYMSVNSTDPGTIFGGTWSLLKDRFLLGVGDTYTSSGLTGGESSHTLTTSEMPSHTHTQNAHSHAVGYKAFGIDFSGSGKFVLRRNESDDPVDGTDSDAAHSATATNQNTGGGQAHNNMPPYYTVYMWRRDA